MKKLLSIASMMLSCIAALAADYYVDANADSATATGSQTAPFTSITAAVNAANAQCIADGLASTIYVKGGEETPYYIKNADDLVTITASNLTLCAWADYGKANIYLDSELSVAINNPKVISVDTNAVYVTIKDLNFYYDVANTKVHTGNSLGKNGEIISIYANYCTVDNCGFYQNQIGTNNDWGLNGAVVNKAIEQNVKKVALYMVVKNCYFENAGRPNARPIHAGSYTEMINNVFNNCVSYYYPIKASLGGAFISNRVVNCIAPIQSSGGSYGEFKEAEIAYNIFVNSTDDTFILKYAQGLNEANIHHNTIIGGGSFAHSKKNNANKIEWNPKIYNNLIVLNPTSSFVFEEDYETIQNGKTTTFKKGSMFYDNVWIATTFVGGSATYTLENYNIEAPNVDSAGLFIDNNLKLAVAPEFIETEDVFSEDFYKLNSNQYSWANGLDTTYETTPAYIGAQEPKAIAAQPGEYFSITSLTISANENTPLSDVTFTIDYALNAGDVTLFWDFDADGVIDYTGTEKTVVYQYPKAGNYMPIVKAVDSATNKEISYQETLSPLAILRTITYVDVLAAANGDGSEQQPYQKISEAASVTDDYGTIYVRGGEDRVYEIDSADDFIVISSKGVTVKSWGDYGNVKVVVVNDLPTLTGNTAPVIFTIEAGAIFTTISDFDFLWYGEKNTDFPGNSLGKNGNIILTYADDTLISNCSFTQEGEDAKSGNFNGVDRTSVYPIAAATTGQGDADTGERLTVQNCRFEGNTGSKCQLNAIWCGASSRMIGNVYTNCNTMLIPIKSVACTYQFISNSMYECYSLRTTYGAWGEFPKADISYNKFITSTGMPFIEKATFGLTGDTVIHHNTVVGSDSFFKLGITSSNYNWGPKIYDNLILLSDVGVIVNDNSTKNPTNQTSSFSDTSSFNNNVYMAAEFAGGTAQETISGYKLTLSPVDCLVVDKAPRFISTDPDNEDAYRLKASKQDWPYTVAVGGYPNFVGAEAPYELPLLTMIIIR